MLLMEGLLGPNNEYTWLEEWRNEALSTVFRPAGPQVASQAQEAWRTGTVGGSRLGGNWLTRLARRAFMGHAVAADVAEGEQHVARLRAALHSLHVRVPVVYSDASGPNILAMDVAEGRSLKEVLDVVANGETDEAQKATAWFAVLLLFVIVPLWGKMLLTVGCCHADPHPGNFKVSGIPGLDEVMPQPGMQTPRQLGLLSRLMHGSAAQEAQDGCHNLILWILDWGSCVDLLDNTRCELCRLVLNLASLRAAERCLQEAESDAEASRSVVEATQRVASCIRSLGLQSDDDEVLAALGMALFDPAVASSHPALANGRAQEEFERGFPVNSSLGKVLRVVAILVGICREIEARMNDEAAGRATGGQGQQTFVELFLVELWRPFAEEGLASPA